MHNYADVSTGDRVRLSTEGSILSPRVTTVVNLVQPKWFEAIRAHVSALQSLLELKDSR